ncbi:hypothetical protein KBY82_06805 [Cyanobium sp. AMD-g]|uniref:hypothetical protein n=1 Tax=Cyanobium sp. AMD-g TaxID=2823699 RepID=UPI0020CC83EC|nr:hypothetical protein [Cyanobium sp. AMD-g]MCP9930489.1 hypothetical protein [Cyanobium sp. AMD-g]
MSHAFGDTPPGREREQIFRDVAKGRTERRGEPASALLQVGTVHRELGQEPQSLGPNQEAVALLRALAASDTSQRGNLGRAWIWPLRSTTSVWPTAMRAAVRRP